VRTTTFPTIAATINLLVLASGSAHAGCALMQPADNQLVITVTAGGTCDPVVVRDSLRYAILMSESAGFARMGRLPSGAFANQQRTTSSNLFKLGTAPSASPPPTRFVMPAMVPAK
jgi:hypothetical protein